MKEFPPFRLDTVNQCLWRHRTEQADERILLTPKAFAVLRYLVEHSGRLVTHAELLRTLWPDTIVQPEVLKSHILEIRNALGDRPKNPLFIETLPRRGYQFIAAISDSAHADTIAPPESTLGKLVGRDRALGELRDRLQRTLRHQRQIVFITGEPGIGKTAVADEFARQVAADVPVVRMARGQCIEGYGGKEAYYPVLEALGQLCRGADGDPIVQALSTQAPTWLVQFPALVKREEREMLQREIQSATRERMLREIGDAVETITADSPLVLIFEDLQWVDHSTVDLISAIARRRAPAKLMLIATYRPVDVALAEHPVKALKEDLLVHQLCREIALKPLGEPEIAEYLAAESSGAKLPPGLAGVVHRHSEGNPLFMVAALDHLTERGLISRENGGWQLKSPLEKIDLEVPESLRQMIEAQIERLTPEEQRALELASVTGISFLASISASAANLDPEDFEDLCEKLSRRHHIVRSAGSQRLAGGIVSQRYEFEHALYREVFYGRLAPGRRAKLHRSVGERLETLFSEHSDEVAPELAHHFEQGSDWQRAIKYLRLVADLAGRRYAHREATAILQHALELSSQLPERERAVVETEILQKLAAIYVVSFDDRAVETYEALSSRAAHYGLIDVEVEALVQMAYPLSWISSRRCLEVIERALNLSSQQRDPLMRARTRASCLVRRIWAGGWNQRDAEECRNALAEIRDAGDRFVLASHLIDYSFIQWISSEYREARRSEVESLAILLEGGEQNPYLSLVHWESQIILPWILLFLGEWGEALREIKSAIAMVEKNGDEYRAHTLRLYQAWVHLQAMDFAGVLAICDAALPVLGDPSRAAWRRFCLALTGSAETALGNDSGALEHLTTAINEMDSHQVIHDWYCRMIIESALTELWLAKGDLARAHPQAERFLKVTLATVERTWQALAWEANARVAMAQRDLVRAKRCIDEALSTMEGFDVPLANWRAHATAAELYAQTAKTEVMQHHREQSRATILRLANSMGAEEPLRKVFLSAPSVRNILATENDRRAESSAEPSPSAAAHSQPESRVFANPKTNI